MQALEKLVQHQRIQLQQTIQVKCIQEMNLKKTGTIDKFGNINGEVSSNGERKSKDEYVNQSMMDAYTCNGTSTKDLYPGFQVFVTEDFLNAKSNTAQIFKNL